MFPLSLHASAPKSTKWPRRLIEVGLEAFSAVGGFNGFHSGGRGGREGFGCFLFCPCEEKIPYDVVFLGWWRGGGGGELGLALQYREPRPTRRSTEVFRCLYSTPMIVLCRNYSCPKRSIYIYLCIHSIKFIYLWPDHPSHPFPSHHKSRYNHYHKSSISIPSHPIPSIHPSHHYSSRTPLANAARLVSYLAGL